MLNVFSSAVRRHCGYRTLSSAVKQPPLLTTGLRQHLSRMLEQYRALQEKANFCSNVTSAREDGRQKQQVFQQLSSLEPVVKLVQQLDRKERELVDLEELADGSGGGELRGLAREELSSCQEDLQQIQHALIRALVPLDAADEGNAILEVRAGVGGKEAALFTLSIFHMYQKRAALRNWKFEVLECDSTVGFAGYKPVLSYTYCPKESGSTCKGLCAYLIKHASASMSGMGVFRTMKHESGVHRVQRVPTTEMQGRTHTSTVSVAILPQPAEIDMVLNSKDIKVETHRSSGPGGQSVNTTDSAVRLTHLPTGLAVRIQDSRSQHKNRAKAMKILSARVYDRKRVEAMVAQRQDRQQQIGSGERHERIRTYNFPQDRVTDHRVSVTVSGVRQFLEGGAELESLLNQLQGQEEVRNITQLLDSYK